MEIDGFLKTFLSPPWHLIVAVFIALSSYILDSWVLFLPAVSAIVLLLVTPCFLIAVILSLFPRLRKSALKAMRCVVILFLGVVAVVGTNHFRKSLTRWRAARLGEACQAYRAKYHQYPKRLDDLVPEFVSAVPSVRVGILGEDGFNYSSHDGPEPFIYYNCLPPFGNCYYYVESRCWVFLD